MSASVSQGRARLPFGVLRGLLTGMSNPFTPTRPSGAAGDEGAHERIDALELTVRELEREIALLRRQLDASQARRNYDESPPIATPRLEAPAQTAAPPALARYDRRGIGEATRSLISGSDLESLVGRYLAPGVAALAVLLGVGTFLKWAIEHGLLNPAVRVGLGLIAATMLAAFGLRLRQRERSFGSMLLGLALAVIQVCAWASGPSLHLVPDNVAFGVAALASMALATFAYQEADELLCCVGFGGAAIAPFVTNSGAASALLLGNYGALVLLSGAWSLRHRSWSIAERVLDGATALYVVALMMMPENQGGPLLAFAIPLVLAIGGTLPTTNEDRLRGRLRILGVFVVVAAARASAQSTPVVSRMRLAELIGLAGFAWIVIVDQTSHLRATRNSKSTPNNTDSLHDWLDACWIPLAIVPAIAVALEADRWPMVWALALSSLVFLSFVARRPGGFLRDGGAFAAALTSIAYALVIGYEHPSVLVSSVAGLGVVFFGLNLWRPTKSWLVVAGLTLIASSVAALLALAGRPDYAYVPLGTTETAVALAVALSWGAAAFLAERVVAAFSSIPSTASASASLESFASSEARDRRLVHAARWFFAAWVFAWFNVEIAHAIDHTTSLLLMITYYAVTGVATVWGGRRFKRPELRRVGLALALLAAIVAFDGARGIEAVAARVAGYLVTAIFLLGIAYWYRRPGPLVAPAMGPEIAAGE